MKYRRFLNVLPCVACIGAAILNLTHPFIHGSFLDGGMLDTIIVQFNLWTSTFAGSGPLTEG